jgi:hypothetical protein
MTPNQLKEGGLAATFFEQKYQWKWSISRWDIEGLGVSTESVTNKNPGLFVWIR